MIDLLTTYADNLVLAFLTTLLLTFLSFSIGFLGGITILFLRSLQHKLFKAIVSLFVEVIRGTPMIVQLFFTYYALPIIGVKLDPFTASVIALGINSAVYQSEYLRAAMNSIPREQWEASYSIGLNNLNTILYVILPQTLRIAIPSLTNELIYILKFSSIAYFVALPELIYTTKWIASKTFRYIEIYTIAAIFYITTSIILNEIINEIEKRISIPGLSLRKTLS